MEWFHNQLIAYMYLDEYPDVKLPLNTKGTKGTRSI